MVDKITLKNYHNLPFKSKWMAIRAINKYGLVISSILTIINLLISWLILFLAYKDSSNELLNAMSGQGYNITNNFWQFSMVMIIEVCGLLLFVTIPFLFFKNNNYYVIILLIISTIFIIVLSIIWINFGINIIFNFELYVKKHAMLSILFVILPSTCNLLMLLVVASFSCWLLVINVIKLVSIKRGFNLKSKVGVIINDLPTNLIPPVNNKTSAIDKSINKKNSNIEIEFAELEYHRLKNAPIGTLPASNVPQNITSLVKTPKAVTKLSSPMLEPNMVDNTNKETNKEVIKQVSQTIHSNNTVIDTPVVTSTLKTQMPAAEIIINIDDNKISPTFITVPEKPLPINTSFPTPAIKQTIWTQEQIDKIWEKGHFANTFKPEMYRKDYAGALMFKNSFISNPDAKIHNNIRSYNWTIVYQRPKSLGGTAELSNLWPLNCMNALTKGMDYPKWKTNVTFNGKDNCLKVKKWKDKSRNKNNN